MYYFTETSLEDSAISTVNNNTPAATLSLLDSNTEMDSLNKIKKKDGSKEGRNLRNNRSVNILHEIVIPTKSILFTMFLT